MSIDDTIERAAQSLAAEWKREIEAGNTTLAAIRDSVRGDVS